MNQPVTVDILRRELELSNAKFKKELKFNLFQGPEKHPIAFVVLLVLIYIAFSIWASLGTSVLDEYVIGKPLSNIQKFLLAALLTFIIYYIYNRYKFTVSEFE